MSLGGLQAGSLGGANGGTSLSRPQYWDDTRSSLHELRLDNVVRKFVLTAGLVREMFG
jgi:hypothetical protein